MNYLLLNNPVLLFGLAITGNMLALGLLPRTAGFTNPGMSSLCLAAFFLNIWALARILHNGMSLSLLVPIMTAVIPILTIAVGVVVYGEGASLGKIGLLVTACCLVAFAARLT